MCGEPGVNAGLKPTSFTIVRYGFAVGQVDSAIADTCAAYADVVFGDFAFADAVAVLGAEGTSLGARAGLKEGVGGVVSRRLSG